MEILAIGGGVAIAILFMVALSLLKPRKVYRASLILQKVGPEKTWHQSLDFIPNQVAKGFFSKVRSKIQAEIDDVKSNKTPEKVFIEQFTYSIGVFLFFFVLYLAFESLIYLLLAFGLGVYFFNEPRRELVNKAKKLREQIRKETPNFALTVRLLIKGQKTPVDALKIACDHGVGPGLQTFADMLKADLDYLNPKEALQKFAWSTKVPELIEFATAMSQYMTLGSGEEGEEILRQMENTFRELDKKLLEREKEIRPAKLRGLNGITMLVAFLFIVTAMVLYLAHMLNKGPQGF
ncbi:Flp pilus assembly protein TadB [Brevibacillus aydinogluensis]|uniref:hypothetical protein n=1 Tax=Brevibacillus aydinogluensis TaxID=927786 RepID=UPI0028935565|nr:hypothetical protein [Brevibacillus aydinogluensis]MDT3417164.1 Flp pilus assembly protein TadB [Brevibacillus aydinogluensis]